MDKTEKLVIDYLNASYGENPEFEEVQNELYNPYTFVLEKRKTYSINGQYICRVMLNDEVEFSSQLLMTILLLFDVGLDEIHPVIEEWFLNRIPRS